MMQTVVKVVGPRNGPNNPLPQPRVTVFPKCGHITRRDYTPGRIWVKIHCAMCSYLYKEREEKNERRARKMKKREARKRKQQVKVERLNMAKKKMASKKVVKKASLKKKGSKTKVGRKLVLCVVPFAPKGSLLAKVSKAFKDAEKRILGENELVALMEKAGVKPEGKKTVKKLVKAILRNMLRAGVVAKQRDIKNVPELAEFLKEGGDEDDDESEDDEEEGDDEESSDEEADDEEGGDEEEADEEEAKPKAKKKVIGKKKTKK